MAIRLYLHTNRPKELTLDLLSNVLNYFSLNANVFFSGNLCGTSHFNDADQTLGHLHLLRSGKLNIRGKNQFNLTLSKPSVIYFPSSVRHSLFADEVEGADLVCARIKYVDGANSPLLQALPFFLHFDLQSSGLLGQSAAWIFDEAFQERSGKQLIINRLCDIFLVNILRQVINKGEIKEGMMAGLSHPQISKVLSKIHDEPEKNWSLTDMASICAMSRSKFAEVFKETIGQTPADYLTNWRISIAKRLVLKNQNMDLVANQIGYESGSALARVFRKKVGQSPKEWLIAQQS